MGNIILGNNYDLIIATTAVTRPDLHSEVFPLYFEFLKNINWIWYIGIDNLDIGVSCEDTKNNILSIYDKFKSDNNSLEFFLNENSVPNKKSFYENASSLIHKVWSLESKSNILWLEDDWKYNKIQAPLTLEELSSMDTYDYIQLVKRHDGVILSFNPGIWGRGLFKEICVDKIDTPKKIDDKSPEKVCVFPVHQVKKRVNRFIKKYCFEDVGREWAKNNNMHRTFKKVK